MAQEILAAKLCEMDTKLCKLHGQIRSREHLSDHRLKEEIEVLRVETAEEEKLIFQSLFASRADISEEFRLECETLKDHFKSAADRLQRELEESSDWEDTAEKRSLLAEYGIDFTMLAADYTLLMALEAIEAERKRKEEANIL